MSLRERLETNHLISPEVAGWPNGTTIVVPIEFGKRIAVYAAIFSSPNNTQFYLATDTGFYLSGLFSIAENMPTIIPQNDNMDPWFLTPKDRGLAVIVSGGPLFGDLYWMAVPG